MVTGASTAPIYTKALPFLPCMCDEPAMGSAPYSLRINARYSYNACFSSLRPNAFTDQNCLSYLPRFNISKGRAFFPYLLPSSVRLLLFSISNSLFLVVCIAYLPKSTPIHLRPNFSATAQVVPLPQKKSATKSPSLLLALIILERRFSFFCVA